MSDDREDLDELDANWDDEAFEDEEEDGLAAERTELAWGRSSLALMVCGVAVARGIPEISGQPAHPYAGAAVLVFGALAWGAGLPYARTRAIAARTGARHMVTPKELAPLAIGTALVGIGAFLIAVLMPA